MAFWPTVLDPATTVGTAAIVTKAVSHLLQEFRRKSADLERLEDEIRKAPANARKTRNRQKAEKLRKDIAALEFRIEQLREKLSDAQAGNPRARFMDDPGSRWDDWLERMNIDGERHLSSINKFAGAAHAALVAATLTFFNAHLAELTGGQMAMIRAILVISIVGLLVSPLHPLLRLAELRRIRGAALDGYGQTHVARFVSYLTHMHRRFSLFIGGLLVLQILAWIASLIVGWNLISSVAATAVVAAGK